MSLMVLINNHMKKLSALQQRFLKFYDHGHWRKLGGANVASAPPHIKCGDIKVCFCITRQSLKFVYL
jgi:hypothetical protein